MSEIRYSILFVNFRSARLLEKALLSLREPLAALSHELIVVNNDVNEKEILAEMEKKYSFRLTSLSENFGFGRANNEGVQVAQGKFLILLNPDTEYISGNFEALGRELDENPDSIFGFHLLTPQKKNEPWTYGKKPTITGLFWSKFFPAMQKKEKKKTEVDWVGGAALALPRETFLRLGGFDENFFLYYEDVDLCLRARAQGKRIFWYPFLSFIHKRGQSHASYRSMKESYFQGQKIYFRKHGSAFENFLLHLLQPIYRFFIS